MLALILWSQSDKTFRKKISSFAWLVVFFLLLDRVEGSGKGNF